MEKLPCKNCLTYPICRSHIRQFYDKEEIIRGILGKMSVTFKLFLCNKYIFNKCCIAKNYVFVRRDTLNFKKFNALFSYLLEK